MIKSPSNSVWSSQEVARALNVDVSGDWYATGISIDSRTINQGDLFIAIKGDATDGHKYVLNAIGNGASAIVISEDIDGLKGDENIIVVDDTLLAMVKLGAYARERTAAKIIGVTGTVGKTSVKEMLASILGDQGQAHYSKGSYNNHWGVPYSLASMHAGSDYGVFEMGMDKAGEITALTTQVKPDIAIITNITPVHMQNFKNLADVANAKSEIFKGLSDDGTAIINIDNECYKQIAEQANKSDVKTILSFGEHKDADARLINIIEASNGSRVTAIIMGIEVEYTIGIAGKHQALNSLAVLLAAKIAGANLDMAIASVKKISAAEGRGTQEKINIGDVSNPITLIDETYNASPAAMNAAFRVMALVDVGRGGRKIAILGDMLELGKNSAKMHEDLALPIKAAGIDLVYTCGSLMKNLHDKLPPEQQGVHKKDSKELAKIVPDILSPGDVVMVKGSKGSKMGAIIEAMREIPKSSGESVK